MKRILVLLSVCCLFLTGCANSIKEGVKCLEENRYEDAVAIFEKQAEKGRNAAEAYRGLGIAYYELGEYEKALNSFTDAEGAGAKLTAVLWQLRGNSYMGLEMYDFAILAYDEALVLEDCTEDMKREMMYNRVAAYEYLASWDKAKEALDAYLELYPDDEEALHEAEFLKTR